VADLCPGCHRPIAVRRAPRCLYCGAALPEPALAAPVAEDPLVAKLRAAYVLLARCRSDGDLAPAAPWLDPALAQTLQQEVDGDRRSGVRHVIDKVTLGAVGLSEPGDAGTRNARIDALYAEYWQDIGSHMILRGLRGAKPHRELWRLEPVAAGSTAPDTGDRCPGCGADVSAKVDPRCPYCGLVPTWNRLGYRLCAIERADPAHVAAEWKQSLAGELGAHGALPEDDPMTHFLTALRDLLS
jgi:hypothetical protein